MNSSLYPVDNLINAIKNENPFDRSLVVTSQDVWRKSFPDVPSLNAHVSDAVFDAIQRVRAGNRRVFGITITAEKGSGKSHVISRIRRRLQFEDSALFVYMSECSDLNRIKSEFLKTLAFSLKQIGSQDVTQWQELAAALVGQVNGERCTPKQLVNGFTAGLTTNPSLIDELTNKIVQIKPNLENPYLAKAILWTLSAPHASFAINWLSGKALAPSQAEKMDLPNPSTEEKESESINTIRQILDLISDYKSIVICFDNLDVLELSDAGFTKAQITADLCKELYDNLKGVILLNAMYPETLSQQIRALSNASAITDRISEKEFILDSLNSDALVTFVSQWLKEFYDEKKLIPPHPVYPFDEAKLRELGREKPPVRRVLKWCAENFERAVNSKHTHGLTSSQNIVLKTSHPVESAYNKELVDLEDTLENYMEDKATIADALRLSFSTLIGQTVEQVEIEDITQVKARTIDKGYLDFKILGRESGKDAKIGVAVLQEAGGRSVQATLKRLINYQSFDLTRGCLVRSKAIGQTASRAREYVSQLQSLELNGKWVKFKSEDIKQLLAILFVSNRREDYELSKEDIDDFIKQERLAIDNYLIREIISSRPV